MPTDRRTLATAARFDRLAVAYAELFSPVIRPFAVPLLDRLALGEARVVADVGCGIGALAGDWRAAAAPGATIAGFDVSEGMLALARTRLHAVLADAARLPVAGGSVDAALTVFVLHLMPSPSDAMREMVRVVREGGTVAAVTWGTEAPGTWESERIMVEELDRAGAAELPRPVANHGLVDSAGRMEALWAAAGATPEKTWTAVAEHRFDGDDVWTLLESYGNSGDRFKTLDAGAQRRVDEAARSRAGDAAHTWRPAIVYSIARV